METGPKVIATAFALAGFTVALIAGMGAGNPASGVLVKAILCMLACHVVGQIVGAIAAKSVGDHLAAYRASHPIPELSTGSQPESIDPVLAGEKSP